MNVKFIKDWNHHRVYYNKKENTIPKHCRYVKWFISSFFNSFLIFDTTLHPDNPAEMAGGAGGYTLATLDFVWHKCDSHKEFFWYKLLVVIENQHSDAYIPMWNLAHRSLSVFAITSSQCYLLWKKLGFL